MLFFKKILISKSLVYLGGAITALGGTGAFTVYQLDLFGKEPIDSSIFFQSPINYVNYWSTLAFLPNFQDYYLSSIIRNMPFSDLERFLTAVSKLEASKIDNDDLKKFNLIEKAKKILQNKDDIEFLKKIYTNENKETCLRDLIADITNRTLTFTFTNKSTENCVKKEWGDLTEGSELLTKFKASDIYILEKWRFGLGKIPPHCINYCPKWYLEKKD